MITSKAVTRCVMGYRAKNERMMSVRLQAKPVNVTLIQVYAPTSDAGDDEREQFYDDLQELLDSTPASDLVLVSGDFNARIGNNLVKLEERGIVGKYGLGRRNDAGENMADFCIANRLCIMNTSFQHHPRRLFTWTHPNGRSKQQIDYVLVSTR